ncbi:MAG: porin family protein [Bacteroidota bacterium]
MNKVIICIFLVVCMSTMTYAQEGFSAKAGFNNVTINADTGGFFDDSDSELGLYFGGGYQFILDDEFMLEPSLLFSFVDDLTSLYIPIMAKYEFAEGFTAQAGPQINYLLEDLPDGEFGLDLAFGAGYRFDENWFVEARYGFELSRGGDFGDVFDFNTLTVGAGYRFN